MPVLPPPVKKLPLKDNQYYQGVYTKKHIVLHHTAGGSAASSIAGWAATPEHIATPYVVDRNGDIFECFDPKYWAYSLGVKGQTSLEKATIAIEITSYGALTFAANDDPNNKYKKGDLITYTKRVIPVDKAVKLDQPFRGYQYWEAYTPEQIGALTQLLPWLIDKFKITLQADRNNFWEYQNPATLPMGIYSHTTVRKDKIDIFPQKEIVDLVYSL
jgi:N-acetyl-anhydromuramyl-L-alanine amidase AmpD